MSELVSIPNPFRQTVVQDVWQAQDVDVESIHHDAFEACLAGLEAASGDSSDSLLIFGEAGAGKTHLLNRLQRHLQATSRNAPDRVLPCVFVYTRLQTNPLFLWQHLRGRLASDLLHRNEGLSQIQRLLAHQLAGSQTERRSPRFWVRALRVLNEADAEAVSQYLGEVAGQLDLRRDLHIVIEHLVRNRFLADATAWLRGESLPESALERLGLGREEPEDREEEARQVVTSLCRFAGCTLPIVFCFDQIEALERVPGDAEAPFRYGRLAADLADADPNVFVISCLQSAYLDQIEANVRAADKDRIFRRRISLAPLTTEQAEELVRRRLDSVAELRELRLRHSGQPFYPFQPGFVASLIDLGHCSPRAIIARCSLRFEELRRGRPVTVRTTDQLLDEELTRRMRDARVYGRVEESGRVLVHGLPLYWSLRRGESPRRERPKAQASDLVFLEDGRFALALCNESNMSSLAARLRRLLERPLPVDAADGRLVLLRDPRLPITRRARKAREYLDTLVRKGASLVQPSVEALAALEALGALLSDGMSGDLALDGAPVSGETVREWLRGSLEKDERFEPLRDLAGRIAEAPEPKRTSEPDPQVLQDLVDLLAQRPIVRLDEAATMLERPERDLMAAARGHNDRVAVLQGPPTLFFEVVAIPVPEEEP